MDKHTRDLDKRVARLEQARNAPPGLSPPPRQLEELDLSAVSRAADNATLWLASDDGSFVNGVDITVDGGWSAAGPGYPPPRPRELQPRTASRPPSMNAWRFAWLHP